MLYQLDRMVIYGGLHTDQKRVDKNNNSDEYIENLVVGQCSRQFFYPAHER